MMKHGGAWLLCSAAAIGAFTPSQALAQTSPSAQPEVAAQQVNEIIVTAQKRAQSIQSVPIAITAATGADLERRSATNIVDIVSKAPNVDVTTSSQGGSNAGFFIRGIGQFDFISTTDPGVGVYMDGVYVARTAGASLDLLDIDRVEVLRGPQGTLFGKNAVGGAISIYTLRPDATSFSGKALARVGEHGRFDVGGTFNLPVIKDILALRISGLTENQKGYARSLFDGHRMNGTKRQVGHATLRWTPFHSFSAELAGDYTHVNESEKIATISAINPNTFVTIPQNAYAIANGLKPYDNRFLSSGYANYAGFHPGDHENIWGTRLTLDWDLGPLNLKSITAYRHLKVKTGLDFDGSPYALGDQSVDEREKQFSQELTLTGKFLDDKLDFASGLYYLGEKGFSGIYLPLSYVGNPDGFDTYTTNYYDNKTYAIYGQGTYHLTTALSLTAGGRYSSEKKIDTIETFANKFFIDLVPPTRQHDKWNFFTWRLAAQYDFSRNAMAYVSSATGFKSGGFNGRAQSVGTFLSFAPEKAMTYEAGLKTRFFDRRLLLNAAVFQTDYKKIQTTLNLTDPVTGVTVNVVGNPADARIRGAELEGQALLGEHFSADFGIGYLSNKYRNIVPGADISARDLLPDTPKWTVNVGAQYVANLPSTLMRDAKLTARLDLAYKSSFFFGAQNSQFNFQHGYTLLNGRLSYGSEVAGWNVALYGKNILDKRYATHKEDLIAFIYAITLPAPPRELGIELVKKF